MGPMHRPRSRFPRFAITSLAFMLVCVPDPVWKTDSGNSSSHRPSITSWAARTIRVRLFFREMAQLLVGQRGAFLDDAERADDRPAPSKAIETDGKSLRDSAGSALPTNGGREPPLGRGNPTPFAVSTWPSPGAGPFRAFDMITFLRRIFLCLKEQKNRQGMQNHQATRAPGRPDFTFLQLIPHI